MVLCIPIPEEPTPGLFGNSIEPLDPSKNIHNHRQLRVVGTKEKEDRFQECRLPNVVLAAEKINASEVIYVQSEETSEIFCTE